MVAGGDTASFRIEPNSGISDRPIHEISTAHIQDHTAYDQMLGFGQ